MSRRRRISLIVLSVIVRFFYIDFVLVNKKNRSSKDSRAETRLNCEKDLCSEKLFNYVCMTKASLFHYQSLMNICIKSNFSVMFMYLNAKLK